MRWIAIAAGLFVCLIGAGALLAVNQNAANSLVAPVSPTPRAADLIPPTPSATTAALTPTPTVQPPTDTPRLPTATPRPPTLTPTPVAPLTGHIVYSVFNPQYTDLKAYDVYISGVDGSDRRLIAPRRRQPQLSPDGRRIALRGMEGGKLNLFILNLQSGVEQLVEHTHEEASLPSWSSDGQLAVFSSSEMPDRAWRLCTINVQRPPENCAWLKVGPYVLLGRYPTWMANGQIVYSGCNYYWGTTGECGLIRVNADGSSPALITAEPQDGVDTAPANAGETVLFMSRRDGNWEIYKVPLAGGKATNLTKNPADDGLPALSPDEKFIAFVSNRSGQWAVWAMRTDGSDARLLFPLGGGYSVEPDMDFMTERISWGP
ncbi:MAG: PD40 domain-containing protein [Chloroflexi bacterium]|nr:PD40 domain-containing protein [Chloroflexota bacterium]